MMGTSPGSHFQQQQQGSPKMLPPRQQPPRPGGLQTSLSLVSPDASGSPNLQERGSNSDQVRESPSESASSRETWPAADALIMAKQSEKEKEGENGFAEHSVVRHISSSDRISIRDVARERVDVICERMQHLPDEFLEKLKGELRGMLEGTGGSIHKEEFSFLQKLVQSRMDLTDKTLVKAHRAQLEILVSIKSGIQAFLHPSVSLSQASLIEVFLYKRCRNIACGSPLPAEDCSCEACSTKNGFCNLCMCVVCNKFDFEVNTCRWIGCDLCSHWTHTDCAIRTGLIGMGASSGKIGSVVPCDMLFKCRACSRTSELLGWVKDVFTHCAPTWDREAMIRELEYVSKIFHWSEDSRGRKLFWKCEELMEKLKGGVAEQTVWKVISQFFQEVEDEPSSKKKKKNPDKEEEEVEEEEEGGGGGGRLIAPQEAFNRIADVVQEAIKKMEMVANEKMRMVKKARIAVDGCEEELKEKAREVATLKMERQKKKQQIEELESIVRLKQAEADMFDVKASEARREAERLQRIVVAKATTEKASSEEDYASRYLKLRLSEAEAEKQYLFEKIKLQQQESARTMAVGGNEQQQQQHNHHHPSSSSTTSSSQQQQQQMLMFCKMQDMLKNIYSVPSSKGQGSDKQQNDFIP
ncbi:OBERON-like protein [Impatiens glandulifera]|uniref:OBERON-like protein n=1 Tax=Impatiens glandulifera TaxID=253017 RepID=UPI001FB12BCF|nr:OBERON-like protein [Impatiens glandulifera]XP_047307618.1 OBERON-like protein [Impatiens glandulifera]XP_047307619.1 OBERON-like protein [Impatiens glandulifera]